MKCTLPNAKSLKKSIKLFHELQIQVLLLDVDASGWSVNAIDASHVAFLLLHLPAAAFSAYEVGSELLTLGINRAALAKALDCAGDRDQLVFVHAAGASTVSITTEAPARGYTRTGTFDVPLMEAERPAFLPDAARAHECTTPIDAARFAADCKALSSFGDRVTLTATDGALALSNERRMCMTQRAAIEWRDAGHAASVSGAYSLKFLNQIAEAVALCATVQVGLSNDAPLYLSYAIEGGGHLTYVLAPKI